VQAPVSWILRVNDGNGKGPGQLQIQTADGMQATCEKLTFRIGAGKPVTLSAQGKQVIVRSEQLAASADCVRRSGPEGASLTLEGNVRLRQQKGGRHAEIFSDQAGINLAPGQVEGNWVEAIKQPSAEVIPGVRIPVAMPGPIPMQLDFKGPAVNGKSDQEQIFAFWQSMFR
jgi:hypothetical protein